jgi:hypothetical protein
VDKKLKAPITRMSLRKRRGLDLCLPGVEAHYLLDVLHSVGWCQAAGMGLAPLTATEVYSWCQLTQTELDAWEFEAIRAASAAYCQQTTSDDPTEPALEK